MEDGGMNRKRFKFRKGYLYVVDYDDHYSSSKVYRKGEATDTTCELRSMGVFCHEDQRVVVLEHQVTVSDRDATNKRVDVHGIVKSCITGVQCLGKVRDRSTRGTAGH